MECAILDREQQTAGLYHILQGPGIDEIPDASNLSRSSKT
jgi:hypothetical protein